MAVKFNNRFFDDLSRSPEVAALVDDVTERIAETARADAPVDTKDYRDGITTASKYQRRYVGLVVGTDKKTLLLESKLGILARALRKNVRRRRV